MRISAALRLDDDAGGTGAVGRSETQIEPLHSTRFP